MKLVTRPLLAMAASFALASSTLAYNGAIYTSLADGTTVNQNIYPSKSSVYLNGGPQNHHGSGLPNGLYFYQVTDPSTGTLLSSDAAANRMLMAYNGRVFGVGTYYGTVTVPGATTYLGATLPVGTHAEGSFNVTNGSVPVQLAPFDDTPNAGGEYKVELIQATDTNGVPISTTYIDANDPKIVHYRQSDSKSDNFKVNDDGGGSGGGFGPQGELEITKFYDANGNGVNDAEAPVDGIEFNVTVWDGPDPQTANILISNVYVSGTDGPGTAIVGPFNSNPDGNFYTITEIVPSLPTNGTWYQTENSGGVSGVLISGGTAQAEFGNFFVTTPCGGLTLGFWSNRNGQGLLQSDDPAWRTTLGQTVGSPLFLRTASGSQFVVGTGSFSNAYGAFRTWLLGATATNMAYMLSAQLATTELNVQVGGAINNYKNYSGGCTISASTVYFVPDSATTLAGAPINGTLGLGTQIIGGRLISVGDIEAAAVASLQANPNTTASGPIRTYQDCLKTLLDAINNNGGSVLSIGFISPTAPPPPYYP